MLCFLLFFYLFYPSLRLINWLVRFIVLYRLFEITLFAVNWIFVHAPRLLSPKRSLAMFLVNIVEIVVLYPVGYLSFGCIDCSLPQVSIDCSPLIRLLTALYTSLRTTATLGPIATHELPQHWPCGVILMTQIIISYFLTIVVIASVIGVVARRDGASTRLS
jgi:hypothetical protein